uniref:Uncharacterized protein n=1 Tax=Nothoprocta perdicaria TaxID=30464 RepID=A0A8C6ZNU9_NOTPE
VVEGWGCVLDQLDSLGEEEEAWDWESRKRLLSCSLESGGQDSPDDVAHEQEEGVPGGRAEVGACVGSYHDVCVSVEELDEFLQAPEAALETAQEELGDLVVCTFQPVVQILQRDPDDLDDGEDEGSEGQRASVVPRPSESREERERRDVVGLLEGPVVGGEGAGERHLAQRDHEVGQPEEHEDVEELEGDEVLVVGALTAVEREEALGVRARLGHVARVERLRGEALRAAGRVFQARSLAFPDCQVGSRFAPRRDAWLSRRRVGRNAERCDSPRGNHAAWMPAEQAASAEGAPLPGSPSSPRACRSARNTGTLSR